ncbi:LrgB-like family-domain-containing protein [Melampsora americana]|nr:LrgB-like family-domain-containing protein [Melampsora americana]
MRFTRLIRNASRTFIKEHGRQIAIHYIQVPLGLIVLLFLAYLVDLVIDLLPFTFPASAVFMIITFFYMILIDRLSPDKLSKWHHAFFGPAADWVLGNMGLFFTTSFILLPRRDAMQAKEIGLICALFVPAFLATWVGTVGICKSLEFFWPTDGPNHQSQFGEQKVKDAEDSSGRKVEISAMTHPVPSSEENEHNTMLQARGQSLELTMTITMTGDVTRVDHEHDLEKGKSTTSKSPSDLESAEDVMVQRMAAWFDPFVYFIIFLIGIPLFFTPGGENRSQPLFLGTVVLSWIFSRRVIPRPWQKVLHPILVTSGITIFLIFVFGSIKGLSLPSTLKDYSTGSTYFVLFRKSRGYNGSPPGAGDIMSTILISGIVCLAFPLFKYRNDLFSNFLRILIVITPNCVVSLLLWGYLARLMGIDGERAITFAARFMSTPFGIDFINATGGDTKLVVVLICVTGILAVLIRDHLFKLLRVRTTVGSEDYFTMGMTIGVIAGAIGTSSLIDTHPRAAATASVSFVLYGIILLSLVAVPTIAEYSAKLAGL